MPSAITSILLAVDGSEHSDQATKLAADLASRFGAKVCALHVVRDTARNVPIWIDYSSRIEAIRAAEGRLLRESGRRIAEQAARMVRDSGVTSVEALIRLGDPVHTIESQAVALGVDAIIMGRRGVGAIREVFPGSVSDGVSRLSKRAVFTVKADELVAPMKHILVAVDGSEHSDRAAELAGGLGAAYDAKLTVVHVLGSYKQAEDAAAFAEAEHVTLSDALRTIGDQITNEAAALARKSGCDDVDRLLEFGASAQVIVEKAMGLGVDVICMGRRGLGGVKGLLLGSVTHQVSHLAECTVATVP